MFSAPTNNEGFVKKFKARLVIQGFSQRAGVDYDETFATVARQESLRQVDVVSVYLNGKLDEEIFMKQPPGFVDKSKPNAVVA